MATDGGTAPSPVSFTPAMQTALQGAAAEASRRGHAIVTIEHLMLMLVREPTAQALLGACGADLTELETELDQYLDLLVQASKKPAADPAYARLLQRAATTVITAGRRELGIAELLANLPRERESYAAMLLHAAGIERVELLRQISHGTREVRPAAPIGSARLSVWFHNDDYTTMELVVQVLREVFGLDEQQARTVMLKIHTEGAAIVAVLPGEEALERALSAYAIADQAKAPLRVALQAI